MKLNTSAKIGNLEIKNRLIMTAMGVGLGNHKGEATDDFIAFYARRAKGGCGLIITGITVEETIETAKAMEDAGVSLLNISAGTYATGFTIVEPTSYEQGWKIPFATEIRNNVNIPVAATGVIREDGFANKLVEDGKVDFVALGRPWLCDPDFGNKALSGNGDDIRKCMSCVYCFDTAGESLISGGDHAKRAGRRIGDAVHEAYKIAYSI